MRRKSGVLTRLCLVALFLFAASSAFADITVTVLPSLAPNVFGSPSWDGYASNALYAIEHNLSSYGDPNSPTYYSRANHFNAAQTIVTGFPSWMGSADPGATFGPAYANELGNRMHFGLDIVATGGETFTINDISFQSTSSPNPLLNYSWGASPWYFSPLRIGFDALGHIYDSPSDNAATQIVRLIYVGSGNSADAYCPGCTTTAEQQDAIDAAARDLGGVTYTGTYSVKDSAGNPFSGSGTFTVDPVPEPTSLVLGVSMLALVGGFRFRRLRSGKA